MNSFGRSWGIARRWELGLVALVAAIALAATAVAVPAQANAGCGAACDNVPTDRVALANQLISFDSQGAFDATSYVTPDDILNEEIRPIAENRPKPGCEVETAILQILVITIKKYGYVKITELNRKCPSISSDVSCASNPSSAHCTDPAIAIDFSRVGNQALSGGAESGAFLTWLGTFLPGGSRAGQSLCPGAIGATGAITVRFDDGCNHQHVDLKNTSRKLNIDSPAPVALDTDGDGVPDMSDSCVVDRGYALYNGCPIPRTANNTDFNADGKSDVFFANPNGQWWVSDSAASGWHNNGTGGVPLDLLQFADFNGDRKADIFWPNPSTGNWQVSYGGTAPWTTISAGNNIPGQELQLGDFNGDGKADVFWANAAKGEWLISYGGNSSWTRTANAVPSTDLRIGDFNGDGKDDVFWTNPNGEWWVSDGGNSPWRKLSYANVFAAQLKFGDINGDGKTDVFWANPTDGWWWVSYGGTSAWARISNAQVNGAQLQLADFNGDHKADVLWPNPADGYWWISSGANTSWSRNVYANVPYSLLVAR